MNIKALLSSISNKISGNAADQNADGAIARNHMGEANCYRPGKNTTASVPVQPGMNQTGFQQPVQPVANQTGYQPPVQPAMNQTGYQPPVQPAMNQTGYQPPVQPTMNQTGYQPPVQPTMNQTGYQQPMPDFAGARSAANVQAPSVAPAPQGFTAQMPYHQQPTVGTGYQPSFREAPQEQPAQRSFFGDRLAPQQPQGSVQQAPAVAPRPGWGNGQGDPHFNYSSKVARVNAVPHGRRADRVQAQQQPVAPQPPVNNVRYMNQQNFVDQNGTAYSMSIRLAQPLSTSRCYRIIEFMRNGETVLVNTELITDEAESDRCLDLLFGAAYAMDCTFTRVAARCLYLIAPRTVQVQSYASLTDMNQKDNAQRWPMSDPSNPQDPSWQRGPQVSPMAAGTGYRQPSPFASMTDFY